MNRDITALERAFELATSGGCLTVAEIKRRLEDEGYSIAQITGRVLGKQLDALIKTRAATNGWLAK